MGLVARTTISIPRQRCVPARSVGENGQVDVPEEVADRLYALPPRQFVAARDEAVGQARVAGDQAAAAALAKLRRPTVAAWLVNLLALRRPELLAELAELAEALHHAQRDLQGDRLRELANQRRAAVSSLVQTARSLAVEVEPELTAAKLPLHEVEATLHAALADRQLAEQVRTGRLPKAAGYDGFGEPGGAQLRLVRGEGGKPAADAAPERPSREAAEAALAGARTAAEAAAAELDRVTTAKREATQELMEIDAALAELTARRADAATRLAEAETAELAARREASVAHNRLAEAQAAVPDA